MQKKMRFICAALYLCFCVWRVWRVRRPATGFLSRQFVAHPSSHYILGIQQGNQESTFLNYWKFSYSTGCPKIKSALGKHLEVAIHGFKLCILYGKREKFGSNPSRPFLGPP